MTKIPAWTKFERASGIYSDTGLPKEFDKLCLERGEVVYLNSRYQVSVTPRPYKDKSWPDMIELSIKRLDKDAIHDWRDLQRIKNELVGPENEAVELYPAESRLMDTANQYYLFVLADPKARFPFGFQERLVVAESYGNSRQRPFEDKPKDALQGNEIRDMVQQYAKVLRAQEEKVKESA